MLKSLTITAALLVAAPALGGNDHLDRSATQVLQNYNIQVSLSELSDHQKNTIVLIAHSGRDGGKRAQILSALGQGLFGNILSR